jgi:penicillin-binding protein 2
LFVAFAPFEKPEIAVAVVVEHGEHGGSAAASVANRILRAYFDGKKPPRKETSGSSKKDKKGEGTDGQDEKEVPAVVKEPRINGDATHD